MIAVLVACVVGAGYVGAAVVARHRAQAAADLAALGAAGRLAAGPQVACSQAAELARAMRSAVAECAVYGLDVLVSVEVPVGLGAWGVRSARASARAGPADEP